MRTKVASFLKLSAQQRRFVAHAISELALARLSLARRSVAELIDELTVGEQTIQPKEMHHGAELDLKLVAWSLETAARNVPWRADCLVQALAAFRWLSRAGYKPRVYFGVKTDKLATSPPLLAHAWVAVDDIDIVGGKVSGDYQPLASPPSRT